MRLAMRDLAPKELRALVAAKRKEARHSLDRSAAVTLP